MTVKATTSAYMCQFKMGLTETLMFSYMHKIELLLFEVEPTDQTQLFGKLSARNDQLTRKTTSYVQGFSAKVNTGFL